MSTLGFSAGERIKDVRCTEDCLVVDLADGRTISVPLVWYPRLLDATAKQRRNWRIIGGGFGIHWPEVDEDLSAEGLLRGAPAPRPRATRRQPTGRSNPRKSAGLPQPSRKRSPSRRTRPLRTSRPRSG